MDTKYIFLNTAPMPYMTGFDLKRFGAHEYHCSRYCECFVLIFMLNNQLKFTEDSILTTLQSGEWYIQKKNTWQSSPFSSPNAEYYYLHFEADYTDDLLNRIKLPVRGQFHSALVLPHLKKMHTLFWQRPQNPLEIQSDFFKLLNLLYTQEETYTSLTSSVMRFLSENLALSVTSQMLSEQFNYSAEYINKRMKAEIGVTAHAYLTGIRMQKAARLLACSEMSVLEIGSECGYTDSSQFYKAFRKFYKKSPSQYRKEKYFS